MESLVRHMFREAGGIELPEPFPVMTYDDAVRDYGLDKPDLRVPLRLTELTDVMKDVDFKVFSGPANTSGGRVVGLRVPGGGSLTRGEIDVYTEYVKTLGSRGLAWIKVNERAKGADGLQSPIVKNLHARAIASILEHSGAADGDLIFFGADKGAIVNETMGALRQKVGHDRGLAEKAGGPCGWWTSRCSSTTTHRSNGRRATTRLPARRTATSSSSSPRRARHTPRP